MKPSRRSSKFSRFMTRGKNNRTARREPIPLFLEGLEDRMAPAVYNVTGFADGAGTITPTGNNTFNASTLRGAVVAADASPDAANTINLPAGTYSLTALPSQLNLTNNMTIQGAGIGSTFVDGGNNGRVFNIGLFTVTINDLTIENGKAIPGNAPVGGPNDAFGGGIFNQGTLTLTNIGITSNTARGTTITGDGVNPPRGGVGEGGGIYNDTGTLVIQNSMITGNQAAGGNAQVDVGAVVNSYGGYAAGGGIFNNPAGGITLSLTGSTVSNNQAYAGEAINLLRSAAANAIGGKAYGGGLKTVGGNLVVAGSTISGNRASGGIGSGLYGDTGGAAYGGGFAFSNGATARIQASTLASNHAYGGQALLQVKDTSGLTSGSASGGGIFNSLSNLTISGNTLIQNNRATGAGVAAAGGAAASGSATGGGIDNLNGVLLIQNSTISTNQAFVGATAGTALAPGYAHGGGIYNSDSQAGSLTLTNSTLSGNQATGSSVSYTGSGIGFFRGGSASGGGLDDVRGNTTITGTMFTNNLATGGMATGHYGASGGFGYGGGLRTSGSTITIQQSTFSGNQAVGGGASYTVINENKVYGGNAESGAIANSSTLTITNSTITGNSALGASVSGGGVITAGNGSAGGIGNFGSSLTILNSTISLNRALGGNATGNGVPTGGKAEGGGIYANLSEGGPLTLTGSTLSGNSAVGGTGTQTLLGTGTGGAAYGGGLSDRGGQVIISTTTFSANTVTGGAGIGDYGGSGAKAEGGGLQTINGRLTIQQSTFSGNLATGGAASNTGTYLNGTSKVTGGTADGGGISSAGTSLTVSDSTISGNSATGGTGTSANPSGHGYGGAAYGGGIYSTVSTGIGASSVTNSTIAFNSATGGQGGAAALGGQGSGGGVFALVPSGMPASFESNIIAKNTSSGLLGPQGPDVDGTFASNGFNLIGSADLFSSGFTNGVNSDQVGTAANPIDPILFPLASNGGLTQTLALGMGSPALGAGANPNNLATDQRGAGFPRTVAGKTDIGAFQSQITGILGFVFNDANDNGVFDNGEMGIAGVTVTLTGNDLNGNPISLTTTTDNTGAFAFPGLQPSGPAGYTLTETQPAGFLPGKASVPAGQSGTVQSSTVINGIVLNFGFSEPNYDFAQLVPSSLAGFVFNDANDNGKFDPNESGIATVTVTLTGTDDNNNPVNIVSQTNAGGAYNFANLRPGTYTITETPPAGFLPGTDSQGTPGTGTVGVNQFTNITLVSGVNGANNNFAELATASLAGFVYNDANDNGKFDGNEQGIANVTVTLTGTDDNNNPVNVVIQTNAGGAYNFANLRPGTYTITETPPAGFLDGTDSQGTPGNGTVGVDQFTNITLVSGVNGANNNFAELVPASLSGFVYNDANDNGVFDPNESGIANVTVTLTGTDDHANPVSMVTQTNTGGAYNFANLRPGTYTITETTREGLLAGTNTQGTPGNGTVGVNQFSNITLVSGVNGANNNFAQLSPATLSGFVFNDANDNGVFDQNESGIANVTVTLTGTDDHNKAVNIVTQTSNGGAYAFNSLRPGTYTITETPPVGFLNGIDTQGIPGNGNSGVDQFSNISLMSGVNGVNNNFAQLLPSSLSGFVFEDVNDTGIVVPGDNGIANVTITLTGFDLQSNPVNLVAHTDVNGVYSFPNLKPGNYTITETPPAGFLSGFDVQGTPGNGNVGVNQFTNINLTTGVNGANNNFAELRPAGLGGFVFTDNNKNGVFDQGDTGFQGATVTLTGSDDHEAPVNIVAQTDAGGAYNFANLRPGIYTITLTPPTGRFIRGANSQGTPGNGTVAVNSFNNISLRPGVLGANNDFAEIPTAGNITPNPVVVSATEGQPFTLPVVTFTDSDGDPVGNFTAAVNWGDGSSSPGTINAAIFGGAVQFSVSGMHAYSEKGIYTIVVTINDTDGSSAMPGSTATVVDAALSASSTPLSAFAGLEKKNLVVASFTDEGTMLLPPINPGGGPTTPVNDYAATINWGDGTAATAGQIIFAGDTYRVVGDHTYAIEGTYIATTTITDLAGQTGPGVTNATVATSAQVTVGGYVTSLYSTLLNRLPDAPGLAGWLQALQNGVTRTQVASAFFLSAEHRGIEVDQLYELILHRHSDPGGRAIWVSDLLGGMSENEIAIQFTVSPEYTASHPTVISFVNGLYNDILGRAADPQGLSFWTQILQNGARTRAGVAYYFLSSGEALSDAITSYYLDFLDRAPDQAGLNAYFMALASGKSSTADVVGEILGSPEYSALILARAIAAG